MVKLQKLDEEVMVWVSGDGEAFVVSLEQSVTCLLLVSQLL